jgi:hypothetical protein
MIIYPATVFKIDLRSFASSGSGGYSTSVALEEAKDGLRLSARAGRE